MGGSLGGWNFFTEQFVANGEVLLATLRRELPVPLVAVACDLGGSNGTLGRFDFGLELQEVHELTVAQLASLLTSRKVGQLPLKLLKSLLGVGVLVIELISKVVVFGHFKIGFELPHFLQLLDEIRPVHFWMADGDKLLKFAE
jgi:hypothetical protein